MKNQTAYVKLSIYTQFLNSYLNVVFVICFGARTAKPSIRQGTSFKDKDDANAKRKKAIVETESTDRGSKLADHVRSIHLGSDDTVNKKMSATNVLLFAFLA